MNESSVTRGVPIRMTLALSAINGVSIAVIANMTSPLCLLHSIIYCTSDLDYFADPYPVSTLVDTVNSSTIVLFTVGNCTFVWQHPGNTAINRSQWICGQP